MALRPRAAGTRANTQHSELLTTEPLSQYVPTSRIGTTGPVVSGVARCAQPACAICPCLEPVALLRPQDFALLRPAAVALGRLPSLRQLSLPETVAQFSSTMTAQADLRVEAAHLRRFYANFAQVAHKVRAQ